MRIMTLYTGNGVSLSPQNAEGRRVSDYVRLVADEGMGITDGNIVTTCIDVLSTQADNWSDCEYIEPEEAEATVEDYEEAIGRFGV